MTFEVAFDPEALEDLRSIRAYERRTILDHIDRLLTVQPTSVSRSRIKRLRGVSSPQYRLRVGGFRVFYDVSAGEVYVMRVLSKTTVDRYLKESGDARQDD